MTGKGLKLCWNIQLSVKDEGRGLPQRLGGGADLTVKDGLAGKLDASIVCRILGTEDLNGGRVEICPFFLPLA